MIDRPSITDAAIQAMLAHRAGRAAPFRIDVATAVAAAGPRWSRRQPRAGWLGRLSVAATGIAAVVVVAMLVAGSRVVAPAGSALPTDPAVTPDASGPASAVAGASDVPEAQGLTLFSPAEAGQIIRGSSDTRTGSIIAVRGRLRRDPAVQCPGVTTCANTELVGSGGGFHVKPVGDIGPGPWDGSGPLVGAFVVRLSPALENDGRVVEFVGVLTTPPSGGPSWFVQDLLEGAAHVDGAYAAVDGWLVRDPLHPCPSDPRNPFVAYGCPTDDWLSESAFQPLQADGSSIQPPAAISLSSGSYDRWAPDPAPGGPGALGVRPRHATYLLWLVSDGCNDLKVRSADCLPPAPRWRIVGRFDSILSVSTPTHGPTDAVTRFPNASCPPEHACL
jgi:hypothetical protein